MRRRTGTALVAALIVGAAAGHAEAATTQIGQIASPQTPASTPGTYAACSQGSGPSYTVPAGFGVITSWSVRNTSMSTGKAKLKVFRDAPQPGGHFVVGESIQHNVGAGPNLTHVAPTRISVVAGDRIGVHTEGGVGGIYGDGGATGNSVCTFNGDAPAGSTAFHSGANFTVLVNISATVQTDNDGDGFGDDTQDSDDDNDGIPDTSDPTPLFADSDQDGTGNPSDNCPATANADQADADGDLQGDACDPDDDNDGIPDASDPTPLLPDSDLDGVGNAADNCPTLRNPDQADADRDLQGNACDPDDDNDGLGDADESRRRTSTVDRDSDDDGLRDDVEVRARLNPARADTDRDGLTDGLERGLVRGVPDPPGTVAGTNVRRFRRDLHPRSKTNPSRRDTDRDGLIDGREDRNHNGRLDRGETNPLRRELSRERRGRRDGAGAGRGS